MYEKDREKYTAFLSQVIAEHKIKHTKTVSKFVSESTNKKYINNYEIQRFIDRGASWKVYLVKRESEGFFAMKKTNVYLQYKRRFYKEDKSCNYFELILNEIKINAILSTSPYAKGKEYVPLLYEVISEPTFNNNKLYIINTYYDLGPLMSRDDVYYEHYHNKDLVWYLIYNIEEFNEFKNIPFHFHSSSTKLLQRNSLPLKLKHKLCRYLFKQIFQGIKYIHSCNIVHSDVKIENLLFSSKGKNCGVVDYSISQILGHEGELIRTDAGGSVHYQPPELFSYENKGYINGFLLDIWSIGVCMYIFIYEKFPFDCDNELELEVKISEGKIEAPFDSENKDFDELLAVLLEKDEKKREGDVEKILEMKYFYSGN